MITRKEAPRGRDKNILNVLIICALWGLGNPVLKISTQTLSPFASVAFRFSVALLLFMFVSGKRIVKGVQLMPLLPCLAVSLCMALAFILGTFALMHSKATTAGFLMGIAVLFTPFLRPLLLRAPFQPKAAPAVAVSLAGMYLLCAGDGSFSFGAGEIFAILCSLSFALMLTLSEKHIGNVDPIALAAMQCGVAALLGLMFAIFLDGGLHIPFTSEALLPVLYLAVGSTCVCCVLQNKAMRQLSATFASVAFCMEPVFTVLFSYILLGETLSWVGAAGALMIIASVVSASVVARA